MSRFARAPRPMWRRRVAALGATGVRASGRALDVGDGPAMRQWVDDVAEEFGGLDIVVPNVSALAATPELESWQKEFSVDMMHTVNTVEAALPHLEKSDAGSIVVISSVSGIEIDFAAGPYGVFKAALIHYSAGLSRQLAPKGIPRQLGLARQHLLRGRLLAEYREQQSGPVQSGAQSEQDRAHGDGRRGWPTRRCSSRARGRASSPAPTSRWTARSPTACNIEPAGRASASAMTAEGRPRTRSRWSATRFSPAPHAGIGRGRRCRSTPASSSMNAQAAVSDCGLCRAIAASSAPTARCRARQYRLPGCRVRTRTRRNAPGLPAIPLEGEAQPMPKIDLDRVPAKAGSGYPAPFKAMAEGAHQAGSRRCGRADPVRGQSQHDCRRAQRPLSATGTRPRTS